MAAISGGIHRYLRCADVESFLVAQKTVAIVQSSYIPWKGTFDLINSVDEFIVLDDVQYTTRDWRNRNRIKGPGGLLWLSIPVLSKGRRFQLIQDVRVADPEWNRVHWKTLRHIYKSARHFRTYEGLFEDLYLSCSETRLSVINRRFLDAICDLLRISTPLTRSSDYEPVAGKTERLVDLCKKAGATRYLSGPTARAYLDEAMFTAEGISVEYFDFSGYPEYDQLYPPFEQHVSIVDLVFNVGPRAREYLKIQ